MTTKKLTETQYFALEKAARNSGPVRWSEFTARTITKLFDLGFVNWVSGYMYQITEAGREWLARDLIAMKTPPKNAKLYLYQNTFQMEEAYKAGKSKAIKNNQLYYLLFTTNKQYVFIVSSSLKLCENFHVHGMFYPDGKWECIEAF